MNEWMSLLSNLSPLSASLTPLSRVWTVDSPTFIQYTSDRTHPTRHIIHFTQHPQHISRYCTHDFMYVQSNSYMLFCSVKLVKSVKNSDIFEFSRLIFFTHHTLECCQHVGRVCSVVCAIKIRFNGLLTELLTSLVGVEERNDNLIRELVKWVEQSMNYIHFFFHIKIPNSSDLSSSCSQMKNVISSRFSHPPGTNGSENNPSNVSAGKQTSIEISSLLFSPLHHKWNVEINLAHRICLHMSQLEWKQWARWQPSPGLKANIPSRNPFSSWRKRCKNEIIVKEREGCWRTITYTRDEKNF